ncbi:cysteine protease [Treponema putidum]|uniref:cysteine protease n=1 Tax=Treponema putidum TaxID=221027 RepID=UPI0021037AAB|nr:cysteine protease [Treponema putidum]UTY31916.1 cysteine protease [Treponema putidum]
MKKFLMITITVCLLAGGVNAFAYGVNSFTVYDAQDKIVHKITDKDEINALYLLFQESLLIAADEASFTELPKDAQELYRYVLSYNYGDNDEQYFSFIVYKNYPLCRIPQLQEKEDIPKELTWKLFKYAYEIAGKPAEVKKLLSYSVKNSYIRIYDDKNTLLLFITGEKILDIFDTLFGEDIAEIEPEERNLKSLFTAESIHNGREVLVHYSFMDDDKIMKLYLYKNTKEMNITTDTGVLKVNLSEEAYRILSSPKSFQKEFEKRR